MNKDSRIYIAGHSGLVGSALVRALEREGYRNIITRPHAELDLMDVQAVSKFFRDTRPEFVVLAAAKVGGIVANNTYPADFIRDNLIIELNVVNACLASGVERLLFLGSSCIYPRDCPQPIEEKYLLTGPLEPTNRPYAIAKIAGIEMCWSFNRQYGTRYLSVMPTNLYGPWDNYHPEHSHVIPGLIRRFHEAVSKGNEQVVVWGTGSPRREFMHSDDMAGACLFLLNIDKKNYDAVAANLDEPPLINVGWGKDTTIKELAKNIAEVTGFEGEVIWDTSKPEGAPRKLLNVDRLKTLGWVPEIELTDGLRQTYESFRRGETRS
jgi:GDP-L-fucose synthase